MSIDDADPKEWTSVGRRFFREPLGDWSIPEKTLKDVIMTTQAASARQHGGTHYKGTNIQAWDVFLDWGLDPWACNVIKYVQRHRKKAGKDDLEKAKHYIEYMIENYEAIGEKYYK